MPFTLVSQPFDSSSRWSTSWILPPVALFILRSVFAVYALFTSFFTLGWDGVHDEHGAGRRFSYFTVLTYWGITGYGVVGAAHTATYWLRGREALKSWPKSLQILHEVLYSTVTVFPWLVTIVYWAILFSSFATPYASWSNVSQHALNAVFAFLEILLPRTLPLPWWHLAPIVLILALYLALAYVTYAVQGWYTYSFLNIQENGSGSVAGYCVGILVASCIIFVVVKYLIWLRVWVTERKLGRMGVWSRHDRHVGADDARVHMDAIASKEGGNDSV